MQKNSIAPPAEVLVATATATTLIYHLRENLVQKSGLLPLKSKVGASTASKAYYDYVAKCGELIFHIRLEH